MNRTRRALAGFAAAIGLCSSVAGCGEEVSRATSFRDEAGHSCRVECPEGSNGCTVFCDQPTNARCGVNQTERWIPTDLAWPSAADPAVLVLCPACDDLYVEQDCSPVVCGAPQDCPFSGHDCVNNRCVRTP